MRIIGGLLFLCLTQTPEAFGAPGFFEQALCRVGLISVVGQETRVQTRILGQRLQAISQGIKEIKTVKSPGLTQRTPMVIFGSETPDAWFNDIRLGVAVVFDQGERFLEIKARYTGSRLSVSRRGDRQDYRLKLSSFPALEGLLDHEPKLEADQFKSVREELLAIVQSFRNDVLQRRINHILELALNQVTRDGLFGEEIDLEALAHQRIDLYPPSALDGEVEASHAPRFRPELLEQARQDMAYPSTDALRLDLKWGGSSPSRVALANTLNVSAGGTLEFSLYILDGSDLRAYASVAARLRGGFNEPLLSSADSSFVFIILPKGFKPGGDQRALSFNTHQVAPQLFLPNLGNLFVFGSTGPLEILGRIDQEFFHKGVNEGISRNQPGLIVSSDPANSLPEVIVEIGFGREIFSTRRLED